MKQPINRRSAIKKTLIAGAVLPFASYLSCTSSAPQEAPKEEKKGLKILILGGTSFLGPHQIAYALSRGHQVSTFTRGKTKPTIHTDIFDKVEMLIGDRADNLTALENGKWDVVIDNSGRKTKWTEKSAELLKDKADLYIYTSSTGVYFPYLTDGISEKTPTLTEVPADLEDEFAKYEYEYGVMKRTSELAAMEAFGKDRTIAVRPTYMIGPGDKTDRFIYWPIRLAKGGELLIPGNKEDRVQYIDVRDVAEFMIRLAEEKAIGIYNAVGPKRTYTMQDFVEEARKTFDVPSSLTWVDDYDFLKKQEVYYLVPWIMPEGDAYGSARINNQKAIQSGLSFRNLKLSIQDTHDWWYSDALTDERRAKYEAKEDGLLMREAAILEAWKG